MTLAFVLSELEYGPPQTNDNVRPKKKETCHQADQYEKLNSPEPQYPAIIAILARTPMLLVLR